MQSVSPFAGTPIKTVTDEELTDMINSHKYIIIPYNLNCRPITPLSNSRLIKTLDGDVYECGDIILSLPKKHQRSSSSSDSEDESASRRKIDEIKRLRRDIQITQNELMKLQDKYDKNQDQYEKLKTKFEHFKTEYFRLTGQKLKIKDLKY